MAITNAQRQYVRDLQHRKNRRKYGAFVVEGIVNVGEVLASAAAVEMLVGTADGLSALRQNAPHVAFPAETYEVGEAAIKRVSAQVRPSGVVAVARTFAYGATDFAGAARVLYLDGVNDPGNAGTLLRTAEWFGLDAVVSSPGSVDFYNPKVVAAARGSLFRMAHGELDLDELLDARPGDRLLVADLSGTPAREIAWPERGVLLVGSESHGPSAAARARLADERAGAVAVTIAGHGRATESLNAAVAGGILMSNW